MGVWGGEGGGERGGVGREREMISNAYIRQRWIYAIGKHLHCIDALYLSIR